MYTHSEKRQDNADNAFNDRVPTSVFKGNIPLVYVLIEDDVWLMAEKLSNTASTYLCLFTWHDSDQKKSQEKIMLDECKVVVFRCIADKIKVFNRTLKVFF